LQGAVREPAVAGTFYPGNPAELRQMVQNHLNNVHDLPNIDGQLMALIVPHAGLVYSGPIAAYSYKLLENSNFNKVIICGPSHRYRFTGLSAYGPFVTWKTPLGDVKCNNELCDALVNYNKKIEIIRQAHEQEHSIEVQLPYLQTVLPDFELVPIVMGSQDEATINLLADALTSMNIDDQTIMIASSDWQHYRPASKGWKLDSLGLTCFEDFDPDRLEKYLATGKVEMCGGGPAAAIMKAARARGADKVKILKYGDSGDASGDKSNVVGYAAIAIYKSNESKSAGNSKKDESKKPENELPKKFELTDSDKSELLKIARTSIDSYLAGKPIPDFDISENLNKFGAAFVTLEEDGRLRGCIGYTSAVEELYKTVSECAVKAAVEDPRFPAVRPEEMKRIHIEISVLTPMQLVESFDDIVVGRDGLMIFKGRNSGLLLPQVAVDYNWNVTQFLEQTCRKAGLNKDAYLSKDVIIYKFQAVIFGE